MSEGLPDFPRDRPLFVFDGHCVLCSRGARWLFEHSDDRINFASAQSTLGEALYAHFGFDADETYLLVIDGEAFTRSDGYLRLARHLGGWWRLTRILKLVPRRIRDWTYDLVAAHRYRWFGKVDQCALLSPAQRDRLL